MNYQTVVTIGEVEGAFETLMEVIRRECDKRTLQVALFVKTDVLDILAGEWRDKAAEERAPVAKRPEEGPDAVRCPSCGQSLVDISFSMFACPECYGVFGDEAVEAAMPF